MPLPELETPFDVPFVPETPFTPMKAMPDPPPAAMAAALKIAAVFLLSSRRCSRSIMASRRPSMWYGRASWSSEQRICGEHRGELCGGKDEVYKKCMSAWSVRCVCGKNNVLGRWDGK